LSSSKVEELSQNSLVFKLADISRQAGRQTDGQKERKKERKKAR